MSSDGGEPEIDEEQQKEEATKIAESLANPETVTKYKAAAEIANKALAFVAAELKPGVKVLDLCQRGDKYIEDETAKVFNKKDKNGAKIDKGLAFPTCVSLNHCVSHWCSDETDATVLAAGDWAKVDLAVHIDGYIASLAHTLVCPPADGAPAEPLSGKQADVLAAAAAASELLPRLARAGLRASAIPAALATVAEAFGVSVVEGVLMHQVKRFVIDGNKVVAAKADKEQKSSDFEFETNDVFVLEAVFSAGEGKPRVLDEKQTGVYKRALEHKKYSLKVKASRAVFSDISSRFSLFPFSLRALQAVGAEREAGPAVSSRTKLGLIECLKNEMLHAYPCLWEKPGEAVAHFKQTVLLMPNGPDPVTGLLAPGALPPPAHASDKALADEGLLALLKEPLKASKSKKKKAGGAAGEAAPMATD